MKIKITNLIFFTFCIINVYCQDTVQSLKFHSMNDFISIKIKSGYTIFGDQSLSLQREGLILWFDSSLSGGEEEVKVIPFKQLDFKKISRIIDYINKHDLINYKEKKRPEDYSRTLDLITFHVVDKNQYVSFYYSICDEDIEILIKMLNDLIPKEDRKKYSIRRRCYD